LINSQIYEIEMISFVFQMTILREEAIKKAYYQD